MQKDSDSKNNLSTPTSGGSDGRAQKTMGSASGKGKSGVNGKKRPLWMKVLVFTGIGLVVVGIIIALLFVWGFFTPDPGIKTESGQDIVIGDTTITENDISGYEDALRAYQEGKDGSFGDDLRKVAEDDLIANAGLKMYAKDVCKINVTERELLERINESEGVPDEAVRATLERYLGKPGDFRWVRNENLLYQQKLEDCVITKRDLFTIEVTIDTPYFWDLPADEAQKAYDEQKKKLEDVFLPMFKEGKTKEEIASSADVNFFDDDRTDDEDYEQYQRGPVIEATYRERVRADFNDRDDVSYPANPGTLYNMSDKVWSLKNTGDYDGVFAARTGVFAIVRLEDNATGIFDSWEDFLDEIKSEYAYTKTSNLILRSKEVARNVISTLGEMLNEPVPYVRAAACDSHWLDIGMYAYEVYSNLPVAGVTTTYESGNSSCQYHYYGTATTNSSGGPGFAFAVNCYGSAGCWNGCCWCVGTPDFDENMYFYDGYDGSLGDWNSSDMNKSGDRRISYRLKYKDIFKLDGASQVRRNTETTTQVYKQGGLGTDGDNYSNTTGSTVYVKPGDTASYRHTVLTDDKVEFRRDIALAIQWTNSGGGVIGTDWDGGADWRRPKSAAQIADENFIANGIKNPGPLYKGMNGASSEKMVRTRGITNSDLSAADAAQGGTYICQRVYYIPKAYDTTDAGASTRACAFVEYNYELNPGPKIDGSTDPDQVREPGEEITVDGLVTNEDRCNSHIKKDNGNNDCYSTKSKPTAWKLTEFVVKPSHVIPHFNGPGRDGSGSYNQTYVNSNNPKYSYDNGDGNTCSSANYGNGSENSIISCSVKDDSDRNGTKVYAEDANNILTNSLKQFIVPDDAEVGTKYCFALSVMPATSHSNNWRHSKPVCITVGKRPKVQILGAGLHIKGKTVTSQTTKIINNDVNSPNRKLYGSWVEYEIVAGSTVTGTASGAAFDHYGLTTPVSGQSAQGASFTATYNTETLTNNNGAAYGNYLLEIANNMANRYNISSTSSINPQGSNISMDGNGRISTSGEIARGKSVVLVHNGTATITTNIEYPNGPYKGLSEIPQVIIIARNIVVQQNVEKVDAWLIAVDDGTKNNGIITTCDVYYERGNNGGNTGTSHSITQIDTKGVTGKDGDGLSNNGLTAYRCDKQLKVNGPVIARKLNLWRTFGSGTRDDSGTPAEVFNLRADAYLWAYYQAQSAGVASTTYSQELPPRW